MHACTSVCALDQHFCHVECTHVSKSFHSASYRLFGRGMLMSMHIVHTKINIIRIASYLCGSWASCLNFRWTIETLRINLLCGTLPKAFWKWINNVNWISFLPERDYVTFGSLQSQFRLSSVVCLYRWCTLLRRLELSAILLHRCVRWPSADLPAKFYGDRPGGTPPSGALNARGLSKYSDFRPIEGYIS